MKDYHINICYSEEDEGYIADIPDLPGCSAFGKSAKQALSEVETATDAWLKTKADQGSALPVPHYRPFIYQLPFGQEGAPC